MTIFTWIVVPVALIAAGIVAGAALAYAWRESKRRGQEIRNILDFMESLKRGTAPPSEEIDSSIGPVLRKLKEHHAELHAEIESLRASEEQQRYYIENVHDVIWSTDKNGRFTFVSPAMERIYGYSSEEALQLTVGGLGYTEEQSEADMEGLFRIMEGEQLVAYEAEHKRKDGKLVVVLINATAKKDEHGEVVGATGTATDITEVKQAEKLLARSLFRESGYSQTLETEVAKRTKELQEKHEALEKTLQELKQAHDRLIVQEKLASLGSLTAGIAHEIKNPLNFVNNFAELNAELTQELVEFLRSHRDELKPNARDECDELLRDIRLNADKVLEHGKRADGIVQAMLSHSRGRAGEYQATDLNALLDEHVNLAYHGMRARDVSFACSINTDYDPAVGKVKVVPQDLGRVFLNIVNNACYAANEKKQTTSEDFKPAISVRTKDLGDAVEIRIRDNGIGMSEDTKNSMFNPFFTTKPAGKGTGLGLSISYDIVVQEHQGQVRVESEEGSYTEFVITLPRTREAGKTSASEIVQQATASSSGSDEVWRWK